MGKKSTYTGASPRDIATDLMDRFITKNDRKKRSHLHQHGQQRMESLPIELQPLKAQLEYYDTNRDRLLFEQKYPCYSVWRNDVIDKSGVYPSSFNTQAKQYRDELRELYQNQTSVREAVNFLKSNGIY